MLCKIVNYLCCIENDLTGFCNRKYKIQEGGGARDKAGEGAKFVPNPRAVGTPRQF